NVELLEEAISTIATIPTRASNLRFDHENSTLWVNEKFSIQFRGNEAKAFGLMFDKLSGKPFKGSTYGSDVAEEIADIATGEQKSEKAVFLTMKRIEAK